MQNRYAGDIGDFGKLGLLRRFSKSGLRIGINWYLTPDEKRTGDGRHISYLKNSSFQECDAKLWEGLRKIVFSGQRNIAALENSGLLTAQYFSDELNFLNKCPAERKAEREVWIRRSLDELHGCDLLFVDPDNGLIVPSADKTSKSNKYVLPSELAEYYKQGASVVYYQHKARRPDAFYVRQHLSLVGNDDFPSVGSLGVKFVTTSLRYYFCLMQPFHENVIQEAVQKMLASAWGKHFQKIL